MDAFDVFKIILGLIISAFIIIMVMNFAGSYIDINASKKQVTDVRTFERSVRDVYVNGIPSNYTFEDETYESITMYRPPRLLTDFTDIDFGFVPLFFKKDSTVSIGRITQDYEWWKFYYVISIPKTKIIFIPLENNDDIWNTIKTIVETFPDTSNVKPNIAFGYGCDKTSPNEELYLDSYTRDTFLGWVDFIQSAVDYKGQCIEYISEDRLPIILSDEIVDFKKGILIVTSGPYWGHIYTNTSGVLRNYTYGDGMDIMAFALGGPDFYSYENEMFLKQLRTAAKLKMNEMKLLESRTSKQDCPALYSVFSGILQQVYDSAGSDYNDDINTIILAENIRRSSDFYKTLEESGCA